MPTFLYEDIKHGHWRIACGYEKIRRQEIKTMRLCADLIWVWKMVADQSILTNEDEALDQALNIRGDYIEAPIPDHKLCEIFWIMWKAEHLWCPLQRKSEL